MNDSELKTLNFQNDFKDNNIDTVFDLEGALIENLSINTNDFKKKLIFNFEYDKELKKLLNIEDIYLKFEEYSLLFEREEYHIYTNVSSKLKSQVLKELKEKISDIDFSKKVSYSFINEVFGNMEHILYANETSYILLENQFNVLALFRRKYFDNEEIDLFNLIEENQNIDFSMNKNVFDIDNIEYVKANIELIESLLKEDDLQFNEYQKKDLNLYLNEWKLFESLFTNDNFELKFRQRLILDSTFNLEDYSDCTFLFNKLVEFNN